MKNWKLDVENPNFISFKHINGLDIIQAVREADIDFKSFTGNWLVQAFKGKKTIIDRWFNNKTKAKQFMKKWIAKNQ